MKKKLVAAFASAMLAGLVVTPAHANPSKGPLAGELLVECSINLDRFPQPVKTTNSSNCNGLVSGNLVGLQSNAPGGYVYATAPDSPVSITAQYTEPCVEGLLGFSNGVGTVTGITIINITKGASVFIGTGTLTVPYSWTRVGATAVITTGKLNPIVDPKKGTQTTLTWATGSASDAIGGWGTGVFIPLAVPDLNCPGTPLTAQIIADIQMV
jgi:hypothetical protein